MISDLTAPYARTIETPPETVDPETFLSKKHLQILMDVTRGFLSHLLQQGEVNSKELEDINNIGISSDLTLVVLSQGSEPRFSIKLEAMRLKIEGFELLTI